MIMDLDHLIKTSLYERILEWLQKEDFCQSYPILAYKIVDIVEDFLPKEQTYCGSQLSAEIEYEIDGYNKAIREIKHNLKNKSFKL